ncbi:hypothetical protein LEMLEM_LOCUS10286, partial [Lemmus lemmus]
MMGAMRKITGNLYNSKNKRHPEKQRLLIRGSLRSVLKVPRNGNETCRTLDEEEPVKIKE